LPANSPTNINYYNNNNTNVDQSVNFSPQQQFHQQANNTAHQQMQSPINQFYNPLQPDMNNLFNDPVASMAVKYGSSLAGQGKEYVAQNVCIFYHLNHSILLDCVQNFEFLG
jgi:hypothetical protein